MKTIDMDPYHFSALLLFLLVALVIFFQTIKL